MTHTIHTNTLEGDTLIIKIRLSDPCKNGHNDFAITGDTYQKDKPLTDKYFLSGGCIHDTILSVKPSLKLFVDLHLSDEQGLPMYAVENGYFWFNNDIKTFAKYMRIDLDTAKELRSDIFKKSDFAQWVEKMKPTYLKQANEAKEILQKMINTK